MCTESDVICGLTCLECDKVLYVGETGRQLKERIQEHIRDIRLSRDKLVATHFKSSNYSINNVQVSVIERVNGQSKVLSLIRESEWINRLPRFLQDSILKKSAKCNFNV